VSAIANNGPQNQAFVLLLLSLLLILPSCKKEKGANLTQSHGPEPATLEYYKEQGIMTAPGRFTYLYDTLPETVPELCRTVQGLLLHVFHTNRYGVNISEQRKKEVRLRKIEDILQREMELADQPLIQPRNPENRVISHCRDYAVLLCSFLRYKRIPARVRVGYATYFNSELHQTHWICEYWCQNRKKWIQVDAQLDDVQTRYYEIDFDPLNIPAGKFLYAGEEYLLIYKKNDDFYDVKRSLIQDLSALNKMEVEVFDVTSFMKIDEHQDSETSKLLNRIAQITTSPRDCLSELRAIYENHSELQVPINN
jgi:excinuclease ABC subunit A